MGVKNCLWSGHVCNKNVKLALSVKRVDTLNAFQTYCEIWNLTINTEKTKVMIFSYGRISKNVHFYINNKELEIVSEFKYLGIYLSRSGSFNAAKKHIAEQANKATFSLLKKVRSLNL